MWQAAACVGQEVGDEGPGIDTAAAACFQDAHGGGVGCRALLGAGAVGDAPGDDGDAQGALGLVVGGGQVGVGDEGDDGGPVVEDFTGERADFFGLVIAVEFAGPFQAGRIGLMMRRRCPRRPRGSGRAARAPATLRSGRRRG